jgi:ribose transport system permease protein
MSDKKKGYYGRNIRNLLLIITIVILVVIFSLVNPIFLRFQNLMNLVSAIAVLSIGSIGMSLVILSGGLDLSIGSNLAISGACAVLTVQATGNAALGMLVTLAVSSMIGAINGFLIGKIKINAVVMTLAMLAMGRSLAHVSTNNNAIKMNNDVYNRLGGGGISVGQSSIPNVLFMIIIFYVVFIVIFKYTTFGRKVAAIGGNADAARAAGIPQDRIVFLIYLITGALIGVATIADVGRVSSSHPYAGMGLEFNAITAVILGGASLGGGKLDLKGTLLGVVLLGVVLNGLALSNVYVYYVSIIKGTLLLIAVISNILIEKRKMI